MTAFPVLEIGGTHVTAAIVDVDGGDVLRQQRVPLDSNASRDAVVGTLVAAARALGSVGPHWGVAIPGPFDYDRGIGRFEGVSKFESLAGVDVGAALRTRIGDDAHTHFVNDADAFGLGEARYGAGRGHSRTVCVTVGTGVGSAFVADGRVVSDGPDVPPNGWAYLLSWDGRPIEDTVSARAIRHRFTVLTGQDRDVHEIAALARDGHPVACEVLCVSFAALGACLGPWVTRFAATAFVLGGSIAGAYDLVESALLEGLQEGSAGEVTLAMAALPETSALLGAAHHAAQESGRAS